MIINNEKKLQEFLYEKAEDQIEIISNVDFETLNIDHVLTEGLIKNHQFINCMFYQCFLQDFQLENVIFEDCSIRECIINSIDCINTKFINTKIKKSILKDNKFIKNSEFDQNSKLENCLISS